MTRYEMLARSMGMLKVVGVKVVVEESNMLSMFLC